VNDQPNGPECVDGYQAGHEPPSVCATSLIEILRVQGTGARRCAGIDA
jgi:hypothetical protein